MRRTHRRAPNSLANRCRERLVRQDGFGERFARTSGRVRREELLHELVPKATMIGVVMNPTNPGTEAYAKDVYEAARARGQQIQILNASTEGEIDTAFASMVQLGVGALLADQPVDRIDAAAANGKHEADGSNQQHIFVSACAGCITLRQMREQQGY